jgi:CRP/FNR family cyclic AMP-dependent transcriptional regulator
VPPVSEEPNQSPAGPVSSSSEDGKGNDGDDEELQFLEHNSETSVGDGAGLGDGGLGTTVSAAAAAAAGAMPAAVPIVGTSVPPEQAVELLSKINIFSGLQPTYLRRIAALGLEELHPINGLIFAEGAQGDKVYLILTGAVRISRNLPGMGEEALAVLRAGTYFGEMALIDEFPRSADARAHEECRLLVIRKEDLVDLLFVDRDLAYDLLWSFVRTLSSRLRETNDKMTFLAVTNRF